MLDAGGSEVEDIEEAVTIHLDIAADRLFDGESSSETTVRTVKTTAEITAEVTQKSGTPITGKYRVRCVYGDNSYSDSDTLNWDANTGAIFNAINNGCLNMRDRFKIYGKSTFTSNTVGTAFFIDFYGYNEAPGQFIIVAEEEEPLMGTMTYNAGTFREFNQNLFFEPIPFEMLHTYEALPQV